ncbi:hypothetical protein Trydic_g8670 [Trypoxylus dichotomus]
MPITTKHYSLFKSSYNAAANGESNERNQFARSLPKYRSLTGPPNRDGESYKRPVRNETKPGVRFAPEVRFKDINAGAGRLFNGESTIFAAAYLSIR